MYTLHVNQCHKFLPNYSTNYSCSLRPETSSQKLAPNPSTITSKKNIARSQLSKLYLQSTN